MSIDVSLVFWTIVNFCLLSVLLNRFLFVPVKTFMRQRQARIDAGMELGVESRRNRQEEMLRLRQQETVALARETEITHAARKRIRQQSLDQLAQASQRAAQRRELVKEALGREREELSEQLVQKLPELTAAMSRKFVEPLAGDVSIRHTALNQELLSCLEERRAGSAEAAGGRRTRRSTRRANAMREGNPELERLAEALAAELPTLSSALVKKIMGTVE